MINAGIIGGAGYTGGELLRILINHPKVNISYIHSTSNAGKPVYAVHHDLLGDTELTFAENFHGDIDVVFLCVGHGDAKKFLEQNGATFKNVKVIDLSQDYRLHQHGKLPELNGKEFIYGLPELNKEKIKTAQNIANPGCFATAIQLGLLPLAHAGLLNEVYITGITGSTGAGQGLAATSHFSWRANNIQAYKTLTHQHLKEITQSLQQLQHGFASIDETHEHPLNFVPWRGDFTRGIFISSQLHCDLSEEELQKLFKDFYANAVFTKVSRDPIFLKQVVNTNKCLIQLEKVGSKLVVHSMIDNLLKGASGQAVQNMNLMFGIDESAGLKLKAAGF